jgi:hypothetical protein
MLRIAIAAMCIASPAFAGTVVCAGKTYREITYAMIEQVGYTEVVRLWVGEADKRGTPKFTIVLNAEMMCEMEDVNLHIFGDND